MNHFKKYINKTIAGHILLILACLMVSSCGKDEPEPQPAEKRKTIIVYMMAENSMSKRDYYHDNLPFTEIDINEMRKAINDIPKDCNFVIYVDDIKNPRIEVLTETNSEHVENLPEHDSADPVQFASNIKTIIERYPAKSYGMVVWSHGSGWIPAQRKKTIGIDNQRNSVDNIGTEMEIADMNEQICKLGIHFDYILLDACFMQCIEVAYELRKVTDYIIASPAEIPGEGAPYDEIMKGLCMDGQNAAEEITNRYFAYHNELVEKSSYPWASGVVISCVKTAELENLLTLTRSILPNFYEQAYTMETSNIQAYGPFSEESFYQPEYHDIGSAMQKMMSGPEYERWRMQLTRTFPIISFTKWWATMYRSFIPSIYDPDNIAACSIFIPNKRYDDATVLNERIKETQWYKDFNAK